MTSLLYKYPEPNDLVVFRRGERVHTGIVTSLNDDGTAWVKVRCEDFTPTFRISLKHKWLRVKIRDIVIKRKGSDAVS